MCQATRKQQILKYSHWIKAGVLLTGCVDIREECVLIQQITQRQLQLN